MHRLLAALLLAATLAPSAVFALDEAPLPDPVPLPAISCPAPEIGPDGVIVVPADAPADCAYISAVPGMESGCIPPESIGSDPADGMAPVCPSVIAPGPDGSCSVSSDGTSTCDDILVPALPEGTRYELRAITLADGLRLEIERGYLLVADGAFTASIGCNTIGGVALEEQGHIRFDSVFSTEMYCMELAETEAALMSLLATGVLHLDPAAAPMTLSNPAGTIELASVTGSAAETATPANGWVAVLLLLIPALAGACALAIGLAGAPRRDA